MSVDEPARISVIIPSFNCARYLGEAIASVLDQGIALRDVIVIDDGSTDDTATVANGFAAVRYRHQPNQGIGAARNHGVSLAQGDLIAFLDADDMWTAGKLRAQLDVLHRMPEVDLVFGHVEVFVDRPDAATPAPVESGDARPGYTAGTMLIRRAAFDRVGPFATDCRLGEFIDWYLRATDAGLKSHLLPQILLRRRVHTTNTGIRERDQRTDYARVLKASLDRRRGRG